MKSTTTTKYQVAIALSFIAILLAVTGVSAASGSLDKGFNGDGLVTTVFANNTVHAKAFDVTTLSDGTLIAVGSANFDFALAKYTKDGALDSNFGTNGKVTTDLGNTGQASDEAYSIAIQSDGKIVVAGGTTTDGGDYQFALVRYNSDGSLDTTFSTDGKVITDLGSAFDSATAVAIQSDGKIIAAGSENLGDNNDVLAVLRYNTDGSLDTTFDTDGIITTTLGGFYVFGNSVVLQPDGKILVGGESESNGVRDLFMARYNSDGALDTSFDGDGIVTTDYKSQEDRGGYLALLPNNKILTAGYYIGNNGSGNGYFTLTRYNSDGSLDTSFGTNGKTNMMVGDAYTMVEDIALQFNGKIVLAGYRSDPSNMKLNFAVACFRSDGSPDTSFGTNGQLATDFGDYEDDVANAVTIQPNGAIVVAGYRSWSLDNTVYSFGFALARYIGEPFTLNSVAAQDGWVLESGENSNAGGALDTTAATFNLGDNAANKQYRGILSFNTGANLPDTAIVSSVVLKLKQQEIIGGGNPVTAFQGFMVDLKDGFFGSTLALQPSDFQAAASKSYGPFKTALVDGWYSINLSAGRNYINTLSTNSGLTQIRLRFKLDDNHNALANYLSLYSGNTTAANRPQLVIVYTVP